MNADEEFRQGRLSPAIEAQTQAVKASPADQGKRLFLFELLAFGGDLDRARKQIDAIKYDEPKLEMAVVGYRKLVSAEQARRDFFRDGVKPKFFGEPPEHVRLRLD